MIKGCCVCNPCTQKGVFFSSLSVFDENAVYINREISTNIQNCNSSRNNDLTIRGLAVKFALIEYYIHWMYSYMYAVQRNKLSETGRKQSRWVGQSTYLKMAVSFLWFMCWDSYCTCFLTNNFVYVGTFIISTN